MVSRSPKKKKKIIGLIPLGELKAKAQKVFNRGIRERDYFEHNGKCISCPNQGNQAGHYFSVKQYDNMRYEEMNVHLQCTYCNKYAHGNLHEYRIGLINRYGIDYVETLERLMKSKRNIKLGRDEITNVINKYK